MSIDIDGMDEDVAFAEDDITSYKRKNLWNLPYRTALKRAKHIQSWFPTHLLCGSVALMLAGVINIRKVSDIDFIVSDISPNANYKKLLITDGLLDFSNQVMHFNIDHPHFHCLFVWRKAKCHTRMYDGVKIQDIDQMIEWKTKYNRLKDKLDLKNYKINQRTLPDSLFKIKI